MEGTKVNTQWWLTSLPRLEMDTEIHKAVAVKSADLSDVLGQVIVKKAYVPEYEYTVFVTRDDLDRAQFIATLENESEIVDIIRIAATRLAVA